MTFFSSLELSHQRRQESLVRHRPWHVDRANSLLTSTCTGIWKISIEELAVPSKLKQHLLENGNLPNVKKSGNCNFKCTVGARIPNIRIPNPFDYRTFQSSVFEVRFSNGKKFGFRMVWTVQNGRSSLGLFSKKILPQTV